MASEVARHLQPFNPILQPSSDEFHLFPKLPLEIRLSIWELALPCERFLRMRLGLTRERDPEQRLSSLVSNGSRTVSSDIMKYQIIVEGSKLVPKLLHVNREARQAASRFYRVQIPCRFEADHRRTALGVLYLNPELDILKVYPGVHQEGFIQMVADLLALDAMSVGLVNLALDLQDMKCLKNLPLDAMKDETRRSFLNVMSRLQKVYFCCLEPMGRLHHGLINFPASVGKWNINRSRPIMGGIPRFQRLLHDPRDLDIDLEEVFIGEVDPRKTIFLWKKMMLQCGMQPHEEMQYHFLVACWSSVGGGQRHIIDQDSAREYIQKELEQCIQICEQWQGRGLSVVMESPEKLEQAPQTAMGFWIYPIESLGEVPPESMDENDAEELFESRRRVEMLEYRPQLALMELP